jgi:NNP family nitrate/nitrite transporter-like MFS transporter
MPDNACPTPEPFTTVIWSILFLTSLFFLTFMSRFIFAPLMPFIEQDLGLTHGQAGSIFLSGSIGYFISSLASGFVASRINHRGALILTLFMAALALLVCTTLTSLWTIRISMLVLGMAAGLHLPSNIATITAMVSRQDWGKALSVQQMAPPLGLVLGPLLTVAIATHYSWRIPLGGIAAIILVVAFFLIRFGKFGDFPGNAPKVSLLRTIMNQKSFWIMIVLFAFGFAGQVGVYAMLPLYLVTEKGLNAELANTLIGLSQISALFMTFLAGWLTDRIGEKRAISLFLSTSGLMTIFLGISSGTWLRVIVFLQPALIVCYFPAGFSALSRIVQPDLRSLTAAWAVPTAFLLGGGLFPAILGYMGQAYTFGLGISLAGCIITIGSVIAFFLNLLEKMDEGC